VPESRGRSFLFSNPERLIDQSFFRKKKEKNVPPVTLQAGGPENVLLWPGVRRYAPEASPGGPETGRMIHAFPECEGREPLAPASPEDPAPL